MLNRYLGGLVAVLGTVGALQAQTPAFPRPKPAFVPSKPAGGAVRQANAEVPPAPKAEAPAPPMPAPAAPGNPVMPTSNLPAGSAWAADVNAACGDTCEAACDALCGPPGRVWIGAEWIHWTAKGNNYPVLATGAPPGTPRPVAGTLGTPGTSNLISGNNVNDDWRSGFRVYGGMWFDDTQRCGIEGNFFYLGDSDQRSSAGSDGTDIVTRPFTNNVRRNADGTFSQVTPYQDTQLVSFPNILRGTITADSKSELIGGGANFIKNLCCTPCARLDVLLGYRYVNLNDTLTIREDLTGLPGSPFPGFRFQVEDRFRTENHFHGGVVGLAYERRFSHFFLGVRSTVALGVNHSIVDISGSTTITDPAGNSTQYAGGLLTQPSNIGRYESDTFAVIPEIGVKLGVQLTDHLRVYGGYNFLYWSSVTRPGDIIDTRVNSSQIPPRNNQTGDLFPRYTSRTSDFWTHGVMVGLEFRY